MDLSGRTQSDFPPQPRPQAEHVQLLLGVLPNGHQVLQEHSLTCPPEEASKFTSPVPTRQPARLLPREARPLVPGGTVGSDSCYSPRSLTTPACLGAAGTSALSLATPQSHHSYMEPLTSQAHAQEVCCVTFAQFNLDDDNTSNRQNDWHIIPSKSGKRYQKLPSGLLLLHPLPSAVMITPIIHRDSFMEIGVSG